MESVRVMTGSSFEFPCQATTPFQQKEEEQWSCILQTTSCWPGMMLGWWDVGMGDFDRMGDLCFRSSFWDGQQSFGSCPPLYSCESGKESLSGGAFLMQVWWIHGLTPASFEIGLVRSILWGPVHFSLTHLLVLGSCTLVGPSLLAEKGTVALQEMIWS